jgi:hypothetical protein
MNSVVVKYLLYIHVTVRRYRFHFNNQPDALIIQNLFCYKTLHVSGIFSDHHREFCTVHSALVSFVQIFDDRFQAESVCSILTLLGYTNVKNTIHSIILYVRMLLIRVLCV